MRRARRRARRGLRRSVGQLDSFVFGIKGVDGDDRAEGLVGVELHARTDAREDRWLVEERSEVGTAAATGDEGGPLG